MWTDLGALQTRWAERLVTVWLWSNTGSELCHMWALFAMLDRSRTCCWTAARMWTGWHARCRLWLQGQWTKPPSWQVGCTTQQPCSLCLCSFVTFVAFFFFCFLESWLLCCRLAHFVSFRCFNDLFFFFLNTAHVCLAEGLCSVQKGV